ncbi:MAG: rhodanese-like domain-containing protein [Acidimicrobiales bacterium]
MADDRSTAGAPCLEPEQAAEMIDAGALLVDVREHHEWHAGHAEQALHVPLAALAERLHELPRDRHVVCVCRSGGRSSVAADALHRAGYSAWNLTGGMSAWVERSLPVVDASGEPGIVV